MITYWYKYTHYECPVCFGGDVIKERQYTKKPKDYHKIHIYVVYYDWCES